MACVCALGIAAPQPVFGVLCQMTQCVWFMSSGKVAFPARMDVRMVNGEILNLLTYNEWWLMFWYRSCSLFRCLSMGVIYVAIKWYVCTQKHIAWASSPWLLDTFTVYTCDESIGRFPECYLNSVDIYLCADSMTSASSTVHTKWTAPFYGKSTLHSQWENV